jgi:hypothetical protein
MTITSSTSADPYRHLRNEESTDHVLNTARHQAGMKTDVHLHGHDVTTSELKEREHEETLDRYRVSKEGAMTIATLGAEALEVATEGSVAGLAAPLLAMKEIVSGVAGDMKLAEELKKAGETDQMHMAVIGALSAPLEFKQEASEPYASTKPGFQSGFMKTSQALDAHPEAKAVLQLHADRGSNAALDLVKTKELHGAASLDAALAKHPDIKKKFDEDPAFRAGMQLIAWSQDKGKLSEVAMSVLERDARYHAAQVQYRG